METSSLRSHSAGSLAAAHNVRKGRSFSGPVIGRTAVSAAKGTFGRTTTTTASCNTKEPSPSNTGTVRRRLLVGVHLFSRVISDLSCAAYATLLRSQAVLMVMARRAVAGQPRLNLLSSNLHPKP